MQERAKETKSKKFDCTSLRLHYLCSRIRGMVRWTIKILT